MSLQEDPDQRLNILERAVEASSGSICISDARLPDMPLIYVNPAFESITGYDRNEVLGRNCRFLQGNDRNQPGLDEIRAALREKRAGEALLRNYRKDGALFLNNLRIAPIHNTQGQLTHYIGLIDDVTDRKKAERTLEESSRHTQAILDNVIDGVITIDPYGIVQSFNRAAERIFGYRAAEIIGGTVNQLMPEPYRSGHDRYIANYLSGAPARVIGLGRETEGVRKNGTVFPMELAVSEIVSDGRYLFIGLVRDISERKRIETELIAAKEKAELASLAKSKFLSSMTHELRTPLNAILGFAGLLQMDETLSHENHENVSEILQAGRHLLALINEVLNLAQIESGNIQVTLESVSIGQIVHDCLALIRPLADARGIKLKDADLTDIAVKADAMRLKQVVLNLLSNAVKYNRIAGEVRLHWLDSEAGKVRLAISDSGVGIAREQLDEVFQPFNRIGAEGLGIQGSGIGLTISRQLIELMGGAIGVDSEVGIGSRFWIELPIADD
ncbi:MAG: hypothetical protein Kow0065_03330 [Methylomicrobium sp.]